MQIYNFFLYYSIEDSKMLRHLAKIIAFFNLKMPHSIVQIITKQISETNKLLLFISLTDSAIAQS